MKRILGMLLGVTALLLFVVAPAQAAVRVIVARMLKGQVQVVGVHAAKKADISWQGGVVTTSTLGGTFLFHNGAVPASCVGKLSDGVETAYIAVQGCVPTGVNVAATGQTDCYDTSGNTKDVVSCTNTGQDGDIRAGVPLPSPRFTVNGDGTVTDNLTGLIWLQDANCGDLNGGGLGVTWSTALTNVAGLKDGTCNLTDGSSAGDWRLPNLRELASLIDYKYSNPPLSDAAGTGPGTKSAPFSNLQLAYWSSTSSGGSAAWVMIFDIPRVSGWDKSEYSYNVLPVRGGS